MITLSSEAFNEILPGFSEFTFRPFYNPTVVVYDKVTAKSQGMRKLEKIGKNPYSRGVYILVDTKPKRGRNDVAVGLSGVDGEKRILLDRIKDHVPDKSGDILNWDQAVVICDWEKDIYNQAVTAGKVTSHRIDQKIKKAMKREVHLLEKMVHFKLKEFEVQGSLNVKGNEYKAFNYCMANPDLTRYNYYISILLECLKNLVPDYDVKPELANFATYIEARKLRVDEVLYGEFDSEAIIIDKSGNVSVEKFKIGTKWAKIEDKKDLQNTSLNKATQAIRAKNSKGGAVSSTEFWNVIRRNKKVRIKDLLQ